MFRSMPEPLGLDALDEYNVKVKVKSCDIWLPFHITFSYTSLRIPHLADI